VTELRRQPCSLYSDLDILRKIHWCTRITTREPSESTYDQPMRILVDRNQQDVLEFRFRYLLVTDLVPSEIACLESSPGRMRRTDVWISRDEMVDFLEYEASSAIAMSHTISDQTKTNSLDASVAIRSKISLTKLLRMAIALLEIPVSG